jgi:hypothetical protein
MPALDRRRRPPCLPGWAAVACLLLAWPVRAQTATRAITTSLVVDVALTGAAVQDLDFARMQSGTAKTVATRDAQTCADGCTAGKWRFQNVSRRSADRYANLQFAVLPDSLVGPGGAKLGVTYSARGCAWWRALNVQLNCVTSALTTAGSTMAIPINAVPGAALSGQPRDIYLWLGGTATPRAGQRAGDYTGVVTVYFFYN